MCGLVYSTREPCEVGPSLQRWGNGGLLKITWLWQRGTRTTPCLSSLSGQSAVPWTATFLGKGLPKAYKTDSKPVETRWLANENRCRRFLYSCWMVLDPFQNLPPWGRMVECHEAFCYRPPWLGVGSWVCVLYLGAPTMHEPLFQRYWPQKTPCFQPCTI